MMVLLAAMLAGVGLLLTADPPSTVKAICGTAIVLMALIGWIEEGRDA